MSDPSGRPQAGPAATPEPQEVILPRVLGSPRASCYGFVTRPAGGPGSDLVSWTGRGPQPRRITRAPCRTPRSEDEQARLIIAAVLATLASGRRLVGRRAPADARSERERVRREAAEVASQLDVLERLRTPRSPPPSTPSTPTSPARRPPSPTASAPSPRPTPPSPPPAGARPRPRPRSTASTRTSSDVAVEAYMNAGTLEESTGDPAVRGHRGGRPAPSLVDLRAGQYRDVLDQLRTLSEELAIARGEAETAAAAASQHQGEVATDSTRPRPPATSRPPVAAEVDARIDHALGGGRQPGRRSIRSCPRRSPPSRPRDRRTGRRSPSSGSSGGGAAAAAAAAARGPVARWHPGCLLDRPWHHRGLRDRRPARLDDGSAAAGRRPHPRRRRLPQLRLPDRPAPGPLRHVRLRDLGDVAQSSCSPPTARPGQSMHERGLAIDFTCGGGGAIGRSSPCFSWLASNAGSYGFINLPQRALALVGERELRSPSGGRCRPSTRAPGTRLPSSSSIQGTMAGERVEVEPGVDGPCAASR